MPKKVAFLGRGELGMNVLKGLLNKSNIEVVIIITCATSPELNVSDSEFKKIAHNNRIPFYSTNYINNTKYINIFNKLDIDIAVAMLWLYKIDHEIISTSRSGFINCHSGLLPEYRGNACGNWSILNEEKSFGITTHFMKPNQLDNGDIINQISIPIDDNTTVTHLTNSFHEQGARLVLDAVDLIVEDKVKIIKQNENIASYCYPRIPEDGYLDWEESADQILRLVNATTRPYPGAYTYFKHYKTSELKKMVIYKLSKCEKPYQKFFSKSGHLIRIDNLKIMAVCCGNNSLLKLDEIFIDNAQVNAYDYFKTVRQRLGIRVEDWIFKINNKISDL